MSTSPVPSDRELQALKILWQRREASVREIFEELSGRGEQLAYTTVLSLLQVMEQKGLVGHRAEGKVYRYFPRVTRDSTFRKLARGFLNSVFDGAMDEYLVHALAARPLTAEELARLERMLADAKRRLDTRAPPAAPPAETRASRRERGGGTC